MWRCLMKTNLKQFCTELENSIKQTYEEGVTIEEAEKLAAKFLHGQLQIAVALRDADLDARMRKSGLKAIKAVTYMEAAKATEKKPSDVYLQNLIDQSDLVCTSQVGLDEAEVERDLLQSYYNTFKEAHIYFRGVSKGRFE